MKSEIHEFYETGDASIFVKSSPNQFQLLATKSNSRIVFKLAKAEKHGEEETDTQDRRRDSKI